MTEKARIVLNFEEKREIKDCFRNVTSQYIALWEEEKLLLDNTDDIYHIENILCDSNLRCRKEALTDVCLEYFCGLNLFL